MPSTIDWPLVYQMTRPKMADACERDDERVRPGAAHEQPVGQAEDRPDQDAQDDSEEERDVRVA